MSGVKMCTAVSSPFYIAPLFLPPQRNMFLSGKYPTHRRRRTTRLFSHVPPDHAPFRASASSGFPQEAADFLKLSTSGHAYPQDRSIKTDRIRQILPLPLFRNSEIPPVPVCRPTFLSLPDRTTKERFPGRPQTLPYDADTSCKSYKGCPLQAADTFRTNYLLSETCICEADPAGTFRRASRPPLLIFSDKVLSPPDTVPVLPHRQRSASLRSKYLHTHPPYRKTLRNNPVLYKASFVPPLHSDKSSVRLNILT